MHICESVWTCLVVLLVLVSLVLQLLSLLVLLLSKLSVCLCGPHVRLARRSAHGRIVLASHYTPPLR